MSESVFANYNPKEPVKNYDDKTETIQQGLDPKVLERIEKAERGEIKARLAAILDRGILNDRLQVDLPDDLHGEWVRNDPLEVRRLESLGFWVDNEHATKRSIHSDGSNSSIVGDVVHMCCQKEIKEVIDEIRAERMIRTHTPKKKGNRNVNREEEQFQEDVDKLHSSGVTSFVNSDEKRAGNKELADLVNSIDSQTQRAD